jgi:hypothetical protein
VVPISCCLSATGIRFSGPPAPAWAFRLPYGWPTGFEPLPDPDGVFTFRMRQQRPGRASSKPRGRWCAPDRSDSSGRHPPPFSGGPYLPLIRPIGESARDRVSSRIHLR